MKTTILCEDGKLEVWLEPETKFEKQVFNSLRNDEKLTFDVDVEYKSGLGYKVTSALKCSLSDREIVEE